MKYIRFSLQLLFLICGMIVKSETPKIIPKSEEDFATKEVRESLQSYVKTLAEIELMARNEAIPKLNEMILRTFRWQDDESMAVYKSAQQKLLSIPDHTKYFTDPIEEAWKLNAERVRLFESQPEWRAALEKSEQTGEVSEGMFDLLGRMWGDYPEICSKNIGILGHIPSTESVWALGRYLQERNEPDIKIPPRGTGILAAESLTALISDGPMQIWMARGGDVTKWQKWFDEVKAGKRTFRFVGSDVDYTLDGPADAKKLERIRNQDLSEKHSGGRREPAMASEKQAVPSKMEPFFHVGLIAAILLCLAAIVFLLKRRNVV